MKKLVLFPILFSLLAFASRAQTSDSIAVRFSENVTLGLSGEALFVKSDNSQYTYHGAGYANVVATVGIGENVQLPLRILSESRNFSEFYEHGSNVVTWIKPAIRIRLPIGYLGIDSVAGMAGDLWRTGTGQGLLLEYFEGQGLDFSVYSGDFQLRMLAVGAGWHYYDDIHCIALRYKDLIGVRYFVDFLNDLPLGIREDNSALAFGVDFNYGLTPGISVYGESAFNINMDNANGSLLGIVYEEHENDDYLSLGIEYRHYDTYFFTPGHKYYTDGPLLFNSITAIDKPYNHTFTYLQLLQEDRDRGVFSVYKNPFSVETVPVVNNLILSMALRKTLLWRAFLDIELEYLTGTTEAFPYELYLGVRIADGVDVFGGIFNRYIFPTEDQRDSPFYRGHRASRYETWLEIRDTPGWMVKSEVRF